MPKRILVDFHHSGLLQSLIMLFEDRLDYQLYRPIGIEWAEQGYWKVYDHPATQQQYLTLAQGYKPVDGSEPLNNVQKIEDDIYYCQDIDSGYFNKAITLDKFKGLEFDILIASLPQHIQPFQELIERYQPQAKLIFQVGNQWDGIYAPNIMASARLNNVPEEINYIEYHQEFNLSFFNDFRRGYTNKSIVSLMNVPEQTPDYPLLLELEKAMPDYQVSIHGGQGRDGPIHGARNVASILRGHQFLWHVKAGGDGYGHILFNSAACGVPAIVKKSYYSGKLGEKLLIDGETCIDIDGLDMGQITAKIRHYTEPARYSFMRRKIITNFRANVNFDAEELKIREFIEKLK